MSTGVNVHVDFHLVFLFFDLVTFLGYLGFKGFCMGQ